MKMQSLVRRAPLAGVLSMTMAALGVANPVIAAEKSYHVRVLVSDGSVPAEHTDPNLVNAWGVTFNPNGVVWVSDNHTGKSTLYNGDGVPQSLVVTIPPAPGSTDPGSPTGIVFNTTRDFPVTKNGVTAPAVFLFASESGTISGWAPTVDGTNALLAADSTASHAIYKGLAIGGNGSGHLLYATDFHNGRVDVFDAALKPITLPNAFVDDHIPAHYAPFGIQNINGNLYVTYAKQDEDAEDDVAGRGFGFVNVFDANGQLVRRLVTRGRLNAPWGLAQAPADFGRFSNALLVGNFGDGRINAYDLPTGIFLGELRGADHRPLVIDGLWGIAFGNGVLNQPVNTLFFAAGPDDEAGGAYGRIDFQEDSN